MCCFIGDTVLAWSADLVLFALDAATGAERWRMEGVGGELVLDGDRGRIGDACFELVEGPVACAPP